MLTSPSHQEIASKRIVLSVTIKADNVFGCLGRAVVDCINTLAKVLQSTSNAQHVWTSCLASGRNVPTHEGVEVWGGGGLAPPPHEGSLLLVHS